MSTDPYPEVSVDESGIVPPQSARPSEWPKKLRTLTAAELDRLTIDNSGRFYWDGKLVNYDTEPKQITDKNAGLARPLDGYSRSREPRARRPQDCRRRSRANSPSRRGSSAEPSAVELDVHRAQAVARRGDGRPRRRADACDAVGMADARRGHRGPGDRGRRARHGHLRLRRSARLGLQDRRIQDGCPVREKDAAAGRHSGVSARVRSRATWDRTCAVSVRKYPRRERRGVQPRMRMRTMTIVDAQVSR